MKRFHMALSALTMSIILIACGSDTTGPTEPGDWLPLAVGNWWHYSLDGYWATSGDTLDISGSFDRNVLSIKDHQGGFQVWEFRSIMHLHYTMPDTTWDTMDTMFVYLRESSEDIRGYEDTVTTDYELMAVFPLTVGDTWNVFSDSTVVCEVTSLTASVTVPAGSFSDCAIIAETDSSNQYYSWDTYLHRGTGIVYEVLENDSNSHLEISLETYSSDN